LVTFKSGSSIAELKSRMLLHSSLENEG
jgi:hypothetical protein